MTKAKFQKFKESEGVKPSVWTPPSVSDMSMVPIVAFDQTLTNTGYVSMKVSRSKDDWNILYVEVLQKGTLKTKSDKTSFRKSFEKGNILAEEVFKLLCYVPCRYIAYEMPAVVGYRTDSSLIAGFAVQREADRRKIPSDMYSAQHVRSVLGGPECKNKKDLIPVLKNYVDDVDTRKWNEHERDALGIGLVATLDIKDKSNV